MERTAFGNYKISGVANLMAKLC